MPSQGARTAMLMSGAMLAALVGSSAASVAASAEEVQPAASAAANFIEDHAAADSPRLNFDVRPESTGRFENLNPYAETAEQTPRQAAEFELGASHDLTGIPLDVSIAQRASFGASDAGDLNRQSRGAEVRIGRALGDPRGDANNQNSRIYMFAASDDQALTWSPGDDSRQWGYQSDRVEIGDHQAGVTYERGAMQASLAYVERKISSTVGTTTHSDNESFAGVTLTMRR